MKVLYIANALIYGFLMSLGFYYLGLDAALTEEFFRVGWENYDGLDLDFYENTYYIRWVGASIFSLALAIFNIKSKPQVSTQIDKFFLGISGFCLLGYFVLYILDGDASLKESKLGWILTAGVQIGLSFLLFYKGIVVQGVDQRLKYLFLLSTAVYAGFLAFGFYCVVWDNELLLKIAAANGDIYDGKGMYREGFDKDVPENTYHLSLMGVTLVSLIIAFFAKESNKWLTRYKILMSVFFLYSVFVYINDGNPDMTETKFWWISLGVLAILNSFILFWKTEDKLPEKIQDDSLLDDLSFLEEEKEF